jgi:hypothetical protein
VFVHFVTPDGLIPTRKDRGADDELDSDADRVTGLTPVFVTGAAGNINGSFDAGFVVPASLSGVVFFDRSGDGIHNGGDEPLAGFETFADFDGDGAMDADEPVAVSNVDGAYTITQALGGTYPITIVDQELWVESVLPPTVVPVGGIVTQINFPVRTSARDSVSVPLGNELRVNSNTTAQKTGSRIAMDANGNYVVAWNSYSQDGAQWGVYVSVTMPLAPSRVTNPASTRTRPAFSIPLRQAWTPTATSLSRGKARAAATTTASSHSVTTPRASSRVRSSASTPTPRTNSSSRRRDGREREFSHRMAERWPGW